MQTAYGNRQTGRQQSNSRSRNPTSGPESALPASPRRKPRPFPALVGGRGGGCGEERAAEKKEAPGTIPGLLHRSRSQNAYDWPPDSPSLANFPPDGSTMYFNGFTVVPFTWTS